MTTLNRRLQLAILNRKKSRNFLQKGFTLVELMVVIVIVGILSGVALPNFLSQSVKAKATECNAKAGAILSQVGSEHVVDKAKAAALLNSEIALANLNTDNCNFANASLTAPLYGINATGKTGGEIEGKYAAKACVHADSSKRELKYETGAEVVLNDVADLTKCTFTAT